MYKAKQNQNKFPDNDFSCICTCVSKVAQVAAQKSPSHLKSRGQGMGFVEDGGQYEPAGQGMGFVEDVGQYEPAGQGRNGPVSPSGQ